MTNPSAPPAEKKFLTREEIDAIAYSRDFSLKTYGKSFYNCDVTKLLNHIALLEADSERMAKALALANSMILSGEKHSLTSEKIINDALSSPPKP